MKTTLEILNYIHKYNLVKNANSKTAPEAPDACPTAISEWLDIVSDAIYASVSEEDKAIAALPSKPLVLEAMTQILAATLYPAKLGHSNISHKAKRVDTGLKLAKLMLQVHPIAYCQYVLSQMANELVDVIDGTLSGGAVADVARLRGMLVGSGHSVEAIPGTTTLLDEVGSKPLSAEDLSKVAETYLSVGAYSISGAGIAAQAGPMINIVQKASDNVAAVISGLQSISRIINRLCNMPWSSDIDLPANFQELLKGLAGTAKTLTREDMSAGFIMMAMAVFTKFAQIVIPFGVRPPLHGKYFSQVTALLRGDVGTASGLLRDSIERLEDIRARFATIKIPLRPDSEGLPNVVSILDGVAQDLSDLAASGGPLGMAHSTLNAGTFQAQARPEIPSEYYDVPKVMAEVFEWFSSLGLDNVKEALLECQLGDLQDIDTSNVNDLSRLQAVMATLGSQTVAATAVSTGFSGAVDTETNSALRAFYPTSAELTSSDFPTMVIAALLKDTFKEPVTKLITALQARSMPVLMTEGASRAMVSDSEMIRTLGAWSVSLTSELKQYYSDNKLLNEELAYVEYTLNAEALARTAAMTVSYAGYSALSDTERAEVPMVVKDFMTGLKTHFALIL